MTRTFSCTLLTLVSMLAVCALPAAAATESTADLTLEERKVAFAPQLLEFFDRTRVRDPELARGVTVEADETLTASPEMVLLLGQYLDEFHREAAELPPAESLHAPRDGESHVQAIGWGLRLRIAENGQLTSDMRRLLADKVVAFHREASKLRPQRPSAKSRPMHPDDIVAFHQSLVEKEGEMVMSWAPTTMDQGVTCYYCEGSVNLCLNLSEGIYNDCVAQVRDLNYCTNLYFDLLNGCFVRYTNCLVACSF